VQIMQMGATSGWGHDPVAGLSCECVVKPSNSKIIGNFLASCTTIATRRIPVLQH
jgi:hypothetical protein